MMRLATLTLSGFKSFARLTTFEFPARSSAIVGPNGSGKSNVAEAIRWALGEQSLKTLRGKRGEDLIFSGSPKTPRMGKAAVTLTFDNRDRSIPLDMETVAIERKAFRDGTNEYYLQGSPVRLKDIVELLAKIGLGEAKHNIIGQGEVDRALGASPRERRELLEEAMGLRLYQLRKREAEKKLAATDENAGQVASLLKEIAPHLKFLKSQAEKAEKREAVERELRDYYRAYIGNETASIAAEGGRLQAESAPAAENLRRLEREIAAISRDIKGAKASSGGEEMARLDEEAIGTLERRRSERERDIGRIEGRVELVGPEKRAPHRVEFAAVEAAISPVASELEAASAIDDLPTLKKRILALATRLADALAKLGRGRDTHAGTTREDLAAERNRLQQELSAIDGEIKRARAQRAASVRRLEATAEKIRERFGELREREDESSALKAVLQRLGFDRERLEARQQDLERVTRESGLERDEYEADSSPFSAMSPEELKRNIERRRARLEEIGGIDETVLEEHRATRSRHDFLERELADLTAASRDLRALVAELEKRIEEDFRAGFAKVKEEFRRYFRMIFGGGTGTISYVPLIRRQAGEEAGEEEPTETEYGIEIEVDLPRKRIKGLAMLSGGERALVSVALLFAITAVNPPPFLVLDETDAALDEANSKKYGDILTELSKKTQLILITHNRETMKHAGILYGVTMGEDGISKILSLKLEEAAAYGNR